MVSWSFGDRDYVVDDGDSRMESLFGWWVRGGCGGLFDVYSKPSKAKVRVWESLQNAGYYRIRVLTYNSHMYTVGYVIIGNDNTIRFCVETKTKRMYARLVEVVE